MLTLLFGFLIGAAIGAVTKIVSGIIEGKSGQEIAGEAFGGAIMGGMLGLISVFGGGLGVGAIAAKASTVLTGLGLATVGAFGAGVVSYAVEKSIKQENIDIGSMFANGGIAVVQGLFIFGLGAAMGSAGMWDSLKPGQGFFSAIKNGFFSGTKSFLSKNVGWMAGRGVIKGMLVSTWGLLRTVLE